MNRPNKIFCVLIILLSFIVLNITCFATANHYNFYGVLNEGEGIYRILLFVLSDKKTPMYISYISDEDIMRNDIIIDGKDADDVVRETFYDGILSASEAKSIKKIFLQYKSYQYKIQKSFNKNGSLVFETEKNNSKQNTQIDYFLKFKGKWAKEKITGEITIYKTKNEKNPCYGLVEMVWIK